MTTKIVQTIDDFILLDQLLTSQGYFLFVESQESYCNIYIYSHETKPDITVIREH